MPNCSTPKSAADLLAALSQNGFLESDPKSVNAFVLEQQQDKELPLYLRALVGVGAFIASFCFIGLVALGLNIRDEEGFVITGVVFVLLAIAWQRLSKNDHTVKSSFFLQSSFALMSTGKTLFTLGMAGVLDTGWGATVALLVITASTYHVYKMSVDRFLSTFAVLFSVMLNVLWDKELAGWREFAFNSIMLAQLVGAAVLIANAKISRDYIPMTYGILFSLSVHVLLIASQSSFGYSSLEEYIDPAFANLLLILGLIASIGWVAGSLETFKTLPIRLASLGAILLGLISAPGVLMAMILLVLGYAKHEKLMVTMGVLLLPVFLFLYYYNLDTTLLDKSLVLIGSGIALILGRLYIVFKGWDKGGVL